MSKRFLVEAYHVTSEAFTLSNHRIVSDANDPLMAALDALGPLPFGGRKGAPWAMVVEIVDGIGHRSDPSLDATLVMEDGIALSVPNPASIEG